MAITSIKTGSSFTNLVKYNDFLGPNPAFNPSSYESIASASLAGLNSITFSSIPSTYASLQLRLLGTNAGNNTVFLTFNGDSTLGNYRNHAISANGTSVVASAATAYIQIGGLYYGFSSNASYLGAIISDIHDYASTTKNKTVRSFNGYDANGSGEIELASGVWLNTSAITSIKVEIGGAAFSTGSTVALYGIK